VTAFGFKASRSTGFFLSGSPTMLLNRMILQVGGIKSGEVLDITIFAADERDQITDRESTISKRLETPTHESQIASDLVGILFQIH